MDDQEDNFCASLDSKSSLSIACIDEECATNDVKNHSQTNAEEEESFICDFCKEGFLKLSDLRRHTRAHLPSVCNVCEKGFSSPALLKWHERSHSGPYVCNVCCKAFPAMRNLKLHLHSHSDEKHYVCDVCNKAFSALSKLKVHRRIHSGEKPYACGLCNRRFSQMHSLKRHSHLHTGFPIQDLCKYPFSESTKVQPKMPKKVAKPCFWDNLRKGFSKSYLKDRREAMERNINL